MSNKMKTIITLFFAILLTTFAHAESSLENIIALSCNEGEYTKIIVLNAGKSNIVITTIGLSYSGKKSDPDKKKFMEALKKQKPGESIIDPDYGVKFISYQACPIVLEPNKAVCEIKVRSDLNVTFFLRIGINGQLITPKTIDVDMTKEVEDYTKGPS